MNINNQVQICFLIFIGNRLYSEQELAINLAELDQAISEGNVIDPQTPNGSLSIHYLGEELWPPELWTDINTIPVSINVLSEGNESKGEIDGQYASIKLKPMGEFILYHLNSVPPSSKHNIARMLPFEGFLQEWVLMGTRMSKLISYLRKKEFKGIDWYFEQASPELRRIVGDEHIKTIAEQDLVEMLSSTPCKQGYYLQEDQTLVKVPFGARNPL
ncbi:MAG: hypothetical protein AAF702_21225 [Chloroflexota bacterium]